MTNFEPPFSFPAGVSDVVYAGKIMGGAVVLGNGSLSSEGFASGTSGWAILGDGSVEFNSGVFRGTLEAGAIDIPDDSTANSFHVDASGNMWVGATTFEGAPFKVGLDGSATATALTVSGTSNLAGANITGTIDAAAVNVTNLVATNITTGTLNGALVGSGVDAGSLTTGDLDVARIVDGTIVTAALDDLAVTLDKLAALSVDNTKITDGSISTPKLQTLSVETGNLASLSVSTEKLVAGSVIAAKIGTSAVETDKLNANAVTAAKLSSIAIEVGKYISSTSYVAGTSGWKILADGSAEFGDVVVRGNIQAATIGDLASDYVEVDTVTNVWKFMADVSGTPTQRGILGFGGASYGHGVYLSARSSGTGIGTNDAIVSVQDTALVMTAGTGQIVYIGTYDDNVNGRASEIRLNASTSVTFKDGSFTYGVMERQATANNGRLQLVGSDNVGGAEGGELTLLASTSGDNNVFIDNWQNTATNDVYARIHNGSTIVCRFRMDSTVYGQAIAGGRAVMISSSGTFGTVTSSARYKKNIQTWLRPSNEMRKMKEVTAKTFEYRVEDEDTSNGERQFGMIAEEMAGVYPELVVLDDKGRPDSINYEMMATVLWGMVGKMDDRIKVLEAR